MQVDRRTFIGGVGAAAGAAAGASLFPTLPLAAGPALAEVAPKISIPMITIPRNCTRIRVIACINFPAGEYTTILKNGVPTEDFYISDVQHGVVDILGAPLEVSEGDEISLSANGLQIEDNRTFMLQDMSNYPSPHSFYYDSLDNSMMRVINENV